MPAPAIRTFHHADFPAADLIEPKGSHTVSVCLPARNEAATVAEVVATIRRELMAETPLVDELVVIDDGSQDATAAVAAEAGARVVATGDVLPEHRGPGKGQAMWKSLHVTEGDVVVWCDADIVNFGSRFVTGLLGPLLTRPDVDFVKGFYERPLDGRLGEGGRVTELVARPLVSLLFPHLGSVVQPLSGEYAGRRRVLERVPFAHGWGVDLTLLVDVAEQVGLERMAQVDLGTRVHRNRSLSDLTPQAASIMATALGRAGIEVPHEVRLARPGSETVTVGVDELPALVDVPAYRRRSA